MCEQHGHGTPGQTLANLRRPMPLKRKLYLIGRNTWLKIRTGSGCCGNYGEPGC